MGLQVILAGMTPRTLEKLLMHLVKLSEVEHILVADTISRLASMLSSQHIDLLFISQPFLQEDMPLLPFIVVGETPDIHQVCNAYIRGAKGYILEDVSEGGLGFIVHAVAQRKEYKFFLNADTTYELLHEATDILIPVTDIGNLSPREQEVLYLLHDGLLNKDVAKQLDIDDVTVRTYIARIKRKLDVATRHQILKLRLPQRPTNPPRVIRRNGGNDFWHVGKIIGLLIVFCGFADYAYLWVH